MINRTHLIKLEFEGAETIKPLTKEDDPEDGIPPENNDSWDRLVNKADEILLLVWY